MPDKSSARTVLRFCVEVHKRMKLHSREPWEASSAPTKMVSIWLLVIAI
jgi:hypothetical protein